MSEKSGNAVKSSSAKAEKAARSGLNAKVLRIMPGKISRELFFYNPKQFSNLSLRFIHPRFYSALDDAMRKGLFDEWMRVHSLGSLVPQLQASKAEGFDEYLSAFKMLYRASQAKKNELVPVGAYFKQMDKIFELYKRDNENHCKMLLYGPPGCGKTVSAKYFSLKHGLRFIPRKAHQFGYTGPEDDFDEGFFHRLQTVDNCVLMVDELDLIGKRREESGSDVATNSVLTELDGLNENSFLFIGASNMPWRLDSALLRSGRIDYCFYVPAPNHEERVSLLEFFLKKRCANKEIDVNALADATEYYSCADLKTLCHKAFLKASLKDENLSQTHFAEAVKESPSTAIEWFEQTSKMTFPSHYIQRFREWFDATQEYRKNKEKAKGRQELLAVA